MMTGAPINDEGAEKIPKMELAQYVFELNNSTELNLTSTDISQRKEKLMTAVKENNMVPFYKKTVELLGWGVDDKLVAEMEKDNAEVLKKLEVVLEDAVENLGETEIREANLAIAEHYCRIGDRENAEQAYAKTIEKTVALGHKLDIVFACIRIGLFNNDISVINANLAKAKSLIEEGGDWDRRNRLKVYEGLYFMTIRNFKKAADLLLSTISTFTAAELIDYETYVIYTVLCSVIALERVEIAEKAVKSPEVHEVSLKHPVYGRFLNSFYECNYREFFQALAEIESVLKSDRYLQMHYQYFVREMRVRAYSQLLESYRSVTLSSIAESFGVSVDYIDRELSRFIAAGRLTCKIDKVVGIVETTRHYNKTTSYHEVIKSGDVLLNRVQKLGRVINL
eukprot:CFRG6634T1